MTNEDLNAPSAPNQPRRSPRQGIGGSPVGSTLSIVLAVVAVIAGFLILKNITDDSGASGGVTDSTTTTSTTIDGAATSSTTTTTTIPLFTEGATVIVANASGVPGSAGRMSTTLETVGFTLGTATNSTGPQLEDSIVYYDPGIAAAQDVADSVAQVMGGLTVEQVPSPPPVDGGSLGDAGVLVMLGTNQSDKTIEEMSGSSADASPTVSAPAVSGDTTGATPAGDATTQDTASADTTG